MATICITGRLGKDAELRALQSGTQVASFSIADDVGYGEKKTTQWIQCALFGKRAEAVAPYLTKGTVVEVVGTPTVEGWEKNGKVSATIKVTVSDVRLHGGGQKRDEPVADKGRATRGRDDGDSIPF